MTKHYNILIIEDQPEIRSFVKEAFAKVENFEVLGAFETCEEALEYAATSTPPDVIIMDIELPKMNGIEGVVEFKKLYPEIDILMFTVFENSEMVFQALENGASGYIIKNTTAEKLRQAVKDVISGGAPMSANIAKMVVASFQKHQIKELTNRENEILGLLIKGKSYQKIADQNFVSIDTIKYHIKNIYRKLQVNTRHEAVEKYKYRF